MESDDQRKPSIPLKVRIIISVLWLALAGFAMAKLLTLRITVIRVVWALLLAILLTIAIGVLFGFGDWPENKRVPENRSRDVWLHVIIGTVAGLVAWLLGWFVL